MPKGGHFAHAEQPDLVVDDLRALFRSIADLGTDRRATSASGPSGGGRLPLNRL
jgi:hypothetical protein